MRKQKGINRGLSEKLGCKVAEIKASVWRFLGSFQNNCCTIFLLEKVLCWTLRIKQQPRPRGSRCFAGMINQNLSVSKLSACERKLACWSTCLAPHLFCDSQQKKTKQYGYTGLIWSRDSSVPTRASHSLSSSDFLSIDNTQTACLACSVLENVSSSFNVTKLQNLLKHTSLPNYVLSEKAIDDD